jgi:hypothetical protein
MRQEHPSQQGYGPFASKDTSPNSPPTTESPLASAVSQGVLLDPPADLTDHGRTQLHDMERIQDPDGVGPLVADRVRVAAERVQRCRLDPAVNPAPRSLSQSA